VRAFKYALGQQHHSVGPRAVKTADTPMSWAAWRIAVLVYYWARTQSAMVRDALLVSLPLAGLCFWLVEETGRSDE
jgi:hypothetical protein